MGSVACNVGSSLSYIGFRGARSFVKEYHPDSFTCSVSSVSYRAWNSGLSYRSGSSLLSCRQSFILRVSQSDVGNAEGSVLSGHDKDDRDASGLPNELLG